MEFGKSSARGNSSYLYAGLDKETSALALELEQMGGGDAALGRFEVHGIVDDRLDTKEKSSAKVLWVHRKTVGIRDIFLPKSTPSADIMSYVSLSSTSKLVDFVQNPGKGALDISGVSSWVLDGFNACVFSYGSRGLGKSLAFFGNENNAVLADPRTPGVVAPQGNAYHNPCVVTGLLKNLYEKSGLPRSSNSVPLQSLKSRLEDPNNNKNNNPESVQSDGFHRGGLGTTIGISCWAVFASRVVDLCSENPPKSYAAMGDSSIDKTKEREYAVVECPSLDAALAVIATARSRCKGAHTRPRKQKGGSPAEDKIADSLRAHFFLRVLVHRESSRDLRRSSDIGPNEQASLLSHLHVVDLIGTALPDADPQFPRLSEADRVARREHALQLQTLARILGQMKIVAKSADDRSNDPRDAPVPALISGRDSLLTSIMSPILQGNCRTVMAAFIKDGEMLYRASKATLTVCEGLAGISQPCHRVSGVPLKSLRMQSVDFVLPSNMFCSKSSRDQLDDIYSVSVDIDNIKYKPRPPSESGVQSLDDSVAEYREFDLLDVAAGVADVGSPVRITHGDVGGLSEAFKAELDELHHIQDVTADPIVNPKPSHQEVAKEKSRFSYANLVKESSVHQVISIKKVSSPPTAPFSSPMQSPLKQGVHRCVFPHGAWIKATPRTDASNIGTINEGEDIDLLDNALAAEDDSNVMFGQLRSGGWIRLEKDGVPVLNHLDDLSSVQLSPAAAKAKSIPMPPLSQIVASQSPAAATAHSIPVPPRSPFSPLRGGLSLLSHASDVASENTLARQQTLAPLSFNIAPKITNAVAQATIASEMLLKAKAAKDRVAALDENNSKELKATVKEDFRQQLEEIYTIYNPDKIATIPAIMANYEGREVQLLAELHKKYNMQDHHVHLLGHDSDSEDITATVVYAYGIQVSDVPSSTAASFGNLEKNTRITLTGRSYCPPHEDDMMYAEVVKSKVTPRGGWIPIMFPKSGVRILEIPQYNYDLMKWPDSRSNSPTMDSPDDSESSDASVRRAIEMLSSSLKSNTPTKRVTIQESSLSTRNSLIPAQQRSPSPVRGASSPPQSRAGAEKSRRSPSPVHARSLTSTASRVDSPAEMRPKGIGQLDKTGPLALSEAGVRALAMARVTTGDIHESAEQRQSPVSKSSFKAHVQDTSFMSASSVGDTTVNGEVELLRRNTASLMEALNLERIAREKAICEVRRLNNELEETRTTLDLLRDDHQLTERRLRGQLNSALYEKDLMSVFSLYEEDIDRGHAELDMLRKRNTELELQQLEEPEKLMRGLAGTSVYEAALRGNHVSGKVRKLQHENEQLVQEMAELKRMKRQYALGIKVTYDSGRKLKNAVQEISDLRVQLKDSQNTVTTVRENLDSIRANRRENLQAETLHREENEALKDEIHMLRARVKEVDEERWRQIQFDTIATSGGNSIVPDLLQTEGGNAAGADEYYQSRTPSYALPTEASRSGRPFESAPVLEGAASLESDLSELHEGLITHAPILLPLLRRVGNSIHHERTRHLKNRADIISSVFPIDGFMESTDADHPNQTALVSDQDIVRAINSRRNYNVDVAASYEGLLRSKGMGGVYLSPEKRIAHENRGNATNRVPRFQNSPTAVGGLDTNAALSALRKHRKMVRDAHAQRAHAVNE